MRKKILWILFIGFLLIGGSVVFAYFQAKQVAKPISWKKSSEEPVLTDADAASRARGFLSRLDQGGFIFGSVLVARGEKILLQASLGGAGINQPMLIGSLTKQFTATLMVKLEQEGKLSLTDPV